MNKLTKAQRARLDKLATYLEGLPKRYRHFDMSVVLDGASKDAALRYARHNGGIAKCGTVACALGHGPAAGILMPPRMVAHGYPEWANYGLLFHPSIDWYDDWCFGANWNSVDNGHLGAAARIRLLLKTGAPPAGFEHPRSKWRKAYAPYRVDAKVPA